MLCATHSDHNLPYRVGLKNKIRPKQTMVRWETFCDAWRLSCCANISSVPSERNKFGTKKGSRFAVHFVCFRGYVAICWRARRTKHAWWWDPFGHVWAPFPPNSIGVIRSCDVVSSHINAAISNASENATVHAGAILEVEKLRRDRRHLRLLPSTLSLLLLGIIQN